MNGSDLVFGIISIGVYWVEERGFGTQTISLSAANGNKSGDFQIGNHSKRFNESQPLDGLGGNGYFPEGFQDHDRDF
jgi:hypothetical protein